MSASSPGARQPLVARAHGQHYGAATTIVNIGTATAPATPTNPTTRDQGKVSPDHVAGGATSTPDIDTSHEDGASGGARKWDTDGLEGFDPLPAEVTCTFDPVPVPGKDYFRTYSDRPVDIAVVIPCYNEDGYDMRRTLIDLDENFRLADVETAHVVVVLDGLLKMSESMRDTFIEDLGFRIGMTAVAKRDDINMDKTYFLQRDPHHRSNIMPNPLFEITCVVKGTNRKKHNSQEWFLRGFCPSINPKIAFLVDCGTCFDPHCVLYLKHSLDTEPGVIAVSGRARVMSVGRQTPEFAEGNCLCMREDQSTCLCCVRSCLRNVQRYEMEATHVVDKPVFSAIGFLPVLPGPCVMIRYQNEDAEVQRNLLASFDWFFDFVHMTPEVAGLVGANLILAEDRILSYAMPLSTGLKTKWVHQALFYFDAETETESLARQRRRWNSGTIAGHVWLFNNAARTLIPVNSVDRTLAPLVNRLPPSRKCCLKALILIELFKIGFNAISPTVFLLGVYYGVQVVFQELANYDPALAVNPEVNQAVGVVLPVVLLVFLMLFVVRHSTLRCGKFSGKVYDKGFFITIMALGVLMSAGAIYAIYTTMRLKIVEWNNEISVGFSFNLSDMAPIDVTSRDYLDGNGHYMLLNKLIFPPQLQRIPETHPMDGKYAPFNEVFQQYQQACDSVLGGDWPVTMLSFSSNAFAELTHPQTQTLHKDLIYIQDNGWHHVYPFCNSIMSNTSNCTATNTMAQLLGAWTVPHLVDKISSVCPESVLASVDASVEWHVACQDWNFDHWFGLVVTVLMLVVLFLPIATHILILELGPVVYLVLGWLPYYLYLPTMVGAYGTYAIAQMNNLSWGNRQSKAEQAQEDSGSKQMQSCVNRAVVAVILGNIGFTIFAICVPDDSFTFIGVFTLINLPAMAEAAVSLSVMIFHYWCCCTRFRCLCRRGCNYKKRPPQAKSLRVYSQSVATPRPSAFVPPDAAGDIVDDDITAYAGSSRPASSRHARGRQPRGTPRPPRPQSIRVTTTTVGRPTTAAAAADPRRAALLARGLPGPEDAPPMVTQALQSGSQRLFANPRTSSRLPPPLPRDDGLNRERVVSL